MKNTTISLIATTLVVLLSGLSSFFIPFIGGIADLMRDMPGAGLTLASSISAVANVALANGCCICIPIPLAFGAFALNQRAKGPALAGLLSQPVADR